MTFAIPVVDDTNTLVGIITVDDALDVIEEEATSDYSGLAGVNVDEATPRRVGRDYQPSTGDCDVHYGYCNSSPL